MTPPEPLPPPANLVRDCEAHLDREQALLDEVRRAVLLVHAATLCGDVAGLEAVLAEQGRVFEAADGLRSARERLRQELAAGLGLPAADTTLGRAARALGGEAGRRLGEARDRLRQTARAVEQANRRNAALLACSLSFLDDLLHGALGTGAGARYGPAGKRQDALSGSFLQARG